MNFNIIPSVSIIVIFLQDIIDNIYRLILHRPAYRLRFISPEIDRVDKAVLR